MSEERGTSNELLPPPYDDGGAPSPSRGGGLPDLGMSARTWAMACHLSALLGFLFPFGNFIGPLVIWMVKKDSMPDVDRHGKRALNFQISISLYVLAACVISVPLMFVVVGFFTLLLAGLAWMVMGVVFPVIAGLKANEGVEYRYPLTIEFIK